MKKIIFSVALVGMAFTAAAGEARPVKKIPFDTTQPVVVNAGPLAGMVVVSTVLKSAETGAVVGECHTLVFEYGGYEKVNGFSCFKK